MVQHLEANEMINPAQHGFRQNRSVISELLSYCEDIISKLENGDGADAIYLDFSKAFNIVDYRISPLKIEALNITGKILQWLEAFLKNRQHCVGIKGHLSVCERILSGVAKGSEVGSLPFLILIIRIDQEIRVANLDLFADDTRIW